MDFKNEFKRNFKVDFDCSNVPLYKNKCIIMLTTVILGMTSACKEWIQSVHHQALLRIDYVPGTLLNAGDVKKK